MLCCIACNGDLTRAAADLWECSQCGACYPFVGGVGVFILPDAMSALSGYAGEIDDARAECDAVAESLAGISASSANTALAERSARLQDGLTANLPFLETVYRPIVDFVRSHPVDGDAFFARPPQGGYGGDHMLQYFYQDWCGTAGYEAVKDLIRQDVAAHCRDSGNAAVLGAGACGLLYSIADYFPVCYGVDLSLPALLMAKKLIEGSPLTFLLREADWRTISVTPPAPPANEIRFLAADAMTLPIKSASLSLVVTQYLLDIVSSAELFTQEMYRVLKPGGVWINFSKPFKVRDCAALGRYRLEELPDYFGMRGFAVERMACRRFMPLDLAAIDAESDNVEDVVHHFVLRKDERLLRLPLPRQSSRFFDGNEDVWREIPRIVTGREAAFFQQKLADGGLDGAFVWLKIMGNLLAVPAAPALLLENLFGLIDGEKTLGDLFALLRGGGELAEARFLALIFCLNRQYGLIELRETAGGGIDG